MAAASKTSNPMDVKESVLIHKASGEEPMVWVGLNGKAWHIPRGKRVEIPKPVADILYQSERAKDEADKYIAEEQERLRQSRENPMY